jgi:hypothetical protein
MKLSNTDTEIDGRLVELKKQISAKARVYAAALKALESVTRALKDTSKNAVALSNGVAALKKTMVGLPVADEFEEITSQLDEMAKGELEKASFLFAKDLRAAFETEGIALKGDPPRFYAEPITIDVDASRARVDLKYGHETLNAKPIALETAGVVAAYAKAKKSLAGRKVNQKEMLDLMFEAYRRVLLQSAGQVGDRVNIVDCYRELVWLKQSATFRRAPAKSTFSEYPRAYFVYDILQLRKSKLLNHRNHRLQFGIATIDATGDDLRTVWVPDGAGDGQYLMDMYWTKE